MSDSERPATTSTATGVKIYRLPTPDEALRMILRRWWLVLLLAGCGTGLGVFGASIFRPTYQSFALLQLRSPVEARIGHGGEGIVGADPTEILRRLKNALSTKETIDPLITKHAHLFTAKELANREALLKMLGDISVDRKTGELYQITVRARSAEAARRVAEGVAEQALAIYRRDTEEQAIRLAEYARQQVEEASAKIKRLEDEMVSFLEKHPVMKLRSLDADPSAQEGDRLRTARRRSPLSVSLERAGEKDPALKELLERRQRLRSELHNLTETATSATTALARSLTEAKTALAELRSQGLKDAHPQVKQALKRIDQLQAKIETATPGAKTDNSEYLTKVRDKLRQVTAELRQQVKAMTTSPGTVPVKKEDLAHLEAEWSHKRRAHSLLTEQLTNLEEVAVNAALKKNLRLFEARKMATVVAQPRLAEEPTGLTGRAIIVAASVVSLLLALMVAFFFGVLDVRLTQPAHITRANESYRILAVLADQPLRAAKEPALIRRPDHRPAAVEEREKDQPAPPAGSTGGMIQWLRGTDDLDQAISLLKKEPAAADAPDEEPDSGWIESVKTSFFDRNAPQPLGAASPSAMVLAKNSATPLGGAQLAPRSGSFAQPRISVLPSAPPFAPGLFVSTQPESRPAEQMRLLASRLEALVGSTLRVVAVTSWESGVGKSTVAANLQMVLAESQKRVLAVDACSGRASLTRIFGIEPNEQGLCEQLQSWLDSRQAGSSPWELTQIAETLTICPASVIQRPALPLLASEAFMRFIGDMRHFFDAIVIDTEALQVASDAVVLQRLVDGYVMVVGRGQSTARSLQAISSRIDQERILGFVFNEHRA